MTRAGALLVAGAVGGILAALLGLVSGWAGGGSRDWGALPDGAVARVGDSLILREDLDRAVLAVAVDSRGAMTDEERARVLARLIDERLLVVRGLELGLAEADPAARKALMSAVIELASGDAAAAEPTEDQLRVFFQGNRAYFTPAPRLRVEHFFFRDRDVAEAAMARLRAEVPADLVRREQGDPWAPAVPDRPLPPAKLREYLGPTVLQALDALEPGGIAGPVASPAGFHVVRLAEREETSPPDFEGVRSQVLALYRRRNAEAALRSYLDDLRERVDVVVRDELG